MAPLGATDQIATARTEYGAGTTAYHSHAGKDTTAPGGDLGAAVVFDLLDFFVWLVARAHLKLDFVLALLRFTTQ
jgi:hypothetical protein